MSLPGTPCRDQHRDVPGQGEQDQLHLALFYASDQEYLDGVMRFIEPALTAGEPVAAAVPPDRARLLRKQLNGSAAKVKILDMFELGRNPSRIIPAVEGMLAECEGSRLHYVGEPIWPGRSQEEIREATKHEALINLAWPGAPISVLCPYDAAALRAEVLTDAEHTHPYVIRGGERLPSTAYSGPTIPYGCDQPLPAPPASARSLAFVTESLSRVRAMVAEVAKAADLRSDRSSDLLLVASELSSNAIRHGRGAGILHVWRQPGEVICQVQDDGHIADPLAGRRRPVPRTIGGLGLWMVNQLCDLVEVRSSERGTTVRAHVTLS
jgi:anti-sigma regulatory factor (Ser/Thr protein kinase)